MTPQQERVLEGAWEEIKRHDAELSGKQVRLTILPRGADAIPENGTPEKPQSLADFLGDFIGSVEGSGANNSENGGEKFAEHLAKKHREGHL